MDIPFFPVHAYVGLTTSLAPLPWVRFAGRALSAAAHAVLVTVAGLTAVLCQAQRRQGEEDDPQKDDGLHD